MRIEYLVIVGAVVNLLGTLHYVRETLHGRTKPNRVTWLMWSIAPMIATGAAVADGVTWAVIPVFMAGFTPFLVFIASFVNPKAYWKLGAFDYLCGFFSALALVLWGITKEPVVAILFAVISDIFASIPTIVKSWRHPDTESGVTWMAGIFSSATGLFVVQAWVFSEYGFLVASIAQQALLLFAIYRRRLITFAPPAR